jgi:hypothetical protein
MSVEVCPICDIAGCRHIRERADLAAANDARIAELEGQLASVLQREADTHARHDAKFAESERQLAEAQALIYAARQERNAAEDAEKELAEELMTVKRQLAEAREVKPLEWKEYPDQGFWRADTVIGEYSVGFDDGWWAQLEGVEFWNWETPEDPRCYSGPNAGMLACQADFTARILSALKDTP